MGVALEQLAVGCFTEETALSELGDVGKLFRQLFVIGEKDGAGPLQPFKIGRIVIQ